MDQLALFFEQYGLWLTLIALFGVVLLGILKYCKVFEKLDKKIRHVCYLAISVGVSLIGSIIYLACTDGLDIAYVGVLTGAIFGLNQIFYAIYSNTSLDDLLAKLWQLILAKVFKISITSENDDTPAEGEVEDKSEVETTTEDSKETADSENSDAE